jgi:UDP-glucuronate 4-epimerase
LFKKYKFTHVAHLAAQAGVRYSLKNPLAYVKSNIECFVVLLEVLRNYPGVKIVYASSSSVYGRNTKGTCIYIYSPTIRFLRR